MIAVAFHSHGDYGRPPRTESSGSLEPPRRPPPTAIGAATPDGEEPSRRPGELHEVVRRRGSIAFRALPIRLAGSMVRGVRRMVRRQLQKIRG